MNSVRSRDDHANEIVKGLWLGDMESAESDAFFKINNIKAVINCTPDVPNKYKGVDYMKINIDDSLKKVDIDKMTQVLPSAVEFIRQKRDREGKNVLVHCHAGMQRSAAIVAAYLCNCYNMCLDHCVAHIMEQRPVAFHHGKHINFSDSLFRFQKENLKVVAPKGTPRDPREIPRDPREIPRDPRGVSRDPRGSTKTPFGASKQQTGTGASKDSQSPVSKRKPVSAKPAPKASSLKKPVARTLKAKPQISSHPQKQSPHTKKK